MSDDVMSVVMGNVMRDATGSRDVTGGVMRDVEGGRDES